MRNERKYRVLIFLTSILAVFLLGNCVREFYRIEYAEEKQMNQYIAMGAVLYAQNCVQCHGPRGEGVVGMPLNKKEFKMDPTTTGGKAVYDLIYNTLVQGRPGTATPRWERVKTNDGSWKWLSYTTMPAWHKDKGGPLDDHHIRGLTLFIMQGNWDIIGDEKKAPYQKPHFEPEAKLPGTGPKGAVTAEDAKAHALLNDLGKTKCLTCHAIGARGSKIGPDLSTLGSWSTDPEWEKFVKEWIRTANTMPHDQRMPIYWSSNRALMGPETDLKTKIVSEGPHVMPAFTKEQLSDEELDIIVDYLLRLK